MNIIVETRSLPTLSALMGDSRKIEIETGSVMDLIRHLIQIYGPKVRQMLLDMKGEMEPTIQILINNEGFLPKEEISSRMLHDGDRVRFFLIAGGG